MHATFDIISLTLHKLGGGSAIKASFIAQALH